MQRPQPAGGYGNYIARSLTGYLERTVRSHTLPADVSRLSDASAAGIAAAESQFTRRGYAPQLALAGLYGNLNPVLLLIEALAAGFAVIGGTGEPFNQPDIFMAAFPNSSVANEATPTMGAPDIAGLKSFANFIRAKFNLDDHTATRMIYPIETLDPPQYDDQWNSLRTAIYKSPSGRFELKSKNVGSPSAHCSCVVKSDNLFFAEDIPLPPPMQRACGEICSPR